MGQKALDRVSITDFPGLITNMDPDDIKTGAGQIQVNVTSARPATLEVRPGFRVVRFEDSV